MCPRFVSDIYEFIQDLIYGILNMPGIVVCDTVINKKKSLLQGTS